MLRTPQDAAPDAPQGGPVSERTSASGEHAKLDPVECPHCGEPHPATYSHCPRTGRPLQTGPALVGRMIAGRYKVTGILGEGGMGAVYIAEHLLLGRKVALKRLHPELAGDEKAVARFQREARAAAATGHEHIVEVLDLGYAEDGAPYLVMEYLRGSSLAQVLKQEGRLPAARVTHILGQVLAALAAVHAQQIVHRDLKPDNVFLTRRGGVADYVKVLDFGISKMKHEDGAPNDLTRTGVTMGTPFYMSPEQARGVRKLDHRVDLYAVAVIAYECLTGRLPLTGDNYHALLQQILRVEPAPPSSLVPGLPAGLDAVVLRGLAKDPDARFETATEMLAALAPFGARADEVGSMVSTQPAQPSGDASPLEALRRVEALAPPSRANVVRSSGSGRRPEAGPHERATVSADTTARAEPPAPASPASPRPEVASPRPEAQRPETQRPEPMRAERPESARVEPKRSEASRAELGAPLERASRTGLERPALPSSSRSPSDRGSSERRPLDTGPRYFYAQSDDWVDGPERRGGSAPHRARAETPSGPGHEPPVEPRPVAAAEARGVRDSAATRPARDEGACRGAIVLGLLDYLEDAMGAPTARTWLARLDPSTRAKVEGVILPMAWLPQQVLESLVQALAADGDPGRVTASGRAVAERELTTTHRLLLQTVSPTSVLERLPHLHRLYFSRGELKVVSVQGGARLELDGGQPESAALLQWMAAFWQHVLELAGAREVKVTATTARSRGDERSSITLRWR
ncbi:MAG: hypothetical protein OHK0013_39010 [Sandaracinaceae bacterium]